MADEKEYKDKPYSPDSSSDPRAKGDPRKVQNPPARETFPGGAGNATAPKQKPAS